MKRLLIFVLALCAPAWAANHYVCPGATGTHSGADWTNAYTGIGSATGNVNPSSMVRGDIYYVANGQVTSASSTIIFNAADSGTSIITVQKAIDGANGTNTGWTNGGTGTCNSSQAVFGPLQFLSDYWTFNGVHRGNGTGNPWLDWRTNYGFYVNNNNGSNSPVNSSWAVQIGSPGSNLPESNVLVEYTEVNGSHDTTGLKFDGGIQFTGGQSSGNYAGYNYVHNVGVQDGIDGDSVNNFTIEYNWLNFNEVTFNNHSEIIALRCWIVHGGETDNGVTIRYNYVENNNGTSSIATPCTTDIGPSNWAIYGNVFLYNSAESDPAYVCHQPASGNQTECDGNPGWLSLWNFATWGGYLYVFNNTISTIDNHAGTQYGLCHHDWGGTSGMTMGDVAFYNNVYYNCLENSTPSSCPGTCTSFVDDYNSYFGMTETNDTRTHHQGCSGGCTSQNPFVNVGQTSNANNFSLTGSSDPTSAWFNTHSLLAANDTDLLGNTRTSSRGALQFQASGGGVPVTIGSGAGPELSNSVPDLVRAHFNWTLRCNPVAPPATVALAPARRRLERSRHGSRLQLFSTAQPTPHSIRSRIAIRDSLTKTLCSTAPAPI